MIVGGNGGSECNGNPGSLWAEMYLRSDQWKHQYDRNVKLVMHYRISFAWNS